MKQHAQSRARCTAKWAAAGACILIAGLWLFAVLAAVLPDDFTPLRIPLWVPLLTAVILWIRWRLPRRAGEG